MIKNQTVLTRKDYLRFFWFHLLRNASFWVTNFIFGVLFILLIGSAFTLVSLSDPSVALFPIVMFCIFLLIWLFSYIIRPYLTYNKIKLAKNTYCFGENHLEIHSESPLSQANVLHDYRAIVKIRESSDAFYLFIEKRKAYILRKDGFYEGTPGDLANLLRMKTGRKF